MRRTVVTALDLLLAAVSTLHAQAPGRDCLVAGEPYLVLPRRLTSGYRVTFC